MYNVIKTILTNILIAFYEPCGFAILLSFFVMFFYLYAYHSENAGKGWRVAIQTWFITFRKYSFFRRLFLLSFVTSLILFRTLLNRNLWMNPLSDVMGGWKMWKIVNGEKQLSTECIENVLLMMPFTAIVMWTFEVNKKVVRKSAAIAFLFSVMIELLQLLLRLGTFQIADIVYNTVGGMLGGIIYVGVKQLAKRGNHIGKTKFL